MAVHLIYMAAGLQTDILVRCRTSWGEPERIPVAQAGRQAACMHARRAVHIQCAFRDSKAPPFKAYIEPIYAPRKGAI